MNLSFVCSCGVEGGVGLVGKAGIWVCSDPHLSHTPALFCSGIPHWIQGFIYLMSPTSAFWGPDTLWRVPSNALFDFFIPILFLTTVDLHKEATKGGSENMKNLQLAGPNASSTGSE